MTTSTGPGAAATSARQHAVPIQPALTDDGLPLYRVDFVVVDLETTGGSSRADAITEIGAVRVRGGEVQGELSTLVNPGRPIPPTITVLTGITDAMVVAAPAIEEVLPTFLEFARGAVLVAHNARFDIGFLRAAAERMALPWPGHEVVDTLALARRFVTRDEAPNHKLGSLARALGSAVTPDHRALTDARATVDVLHGLLARMAPLGIEHLEDLRTAGDPVPQARRRKAHLASQLPQSPGVYQFLDAAGRVLYVGTATNLRRRVRSYFTASEKRRRIGEMVAVADRVHPIVCATPLEAAVRELRLIAEHRPPYNRRSRHPEREPWIRLTDEAFPRASIVYRPPLDAIAVFGPFRSRAQATLALEALHGGFALRRCTERLPLQPRPGATSCALETLGRCGAPCTGKQDAAGYGEVITSLHKVAVGLSDAALAGARDRISALVAQQRFEEAAGERDRYTALLRGAARAQRVAAVALPHLVAARATQQGGWELACARYGRLAGSMLVPRGASPRAAVRALVATAEEVAPPERWGEAAMAEESELIAEWLERPGTRIVEISPGHGWAMPVAAASRVLADLPAWLAPEVA